MSDELFNVVQFFDDGTNEYVRKNVTAMEAVVAAKHFCNSVGAQIGMVTQVMITNGLDECCFLWKYGEGIVFPKPEDRPQ
jgi:hypothetical protein